MLVPLVQSEVALLQDQGLNLLQEMMCLSIGKAIAMHRKYASRSQRRMALILVTDESGDRDKCREPVDAAELGCREGHRSQTAASRLFEQRVYRKDHREVQDHTDHRCRDRREGSVERLVAA